MTNMQKQETLASIIRNDQNLYEGNLIHYFQVIFFKSQNLFNPYHNFRHTFHMLWLCNEACKHYKDILTPREMRNIDVAAMFHDVDHAGMLGEDDLNIERSIRALRKYIAKEDTQELYAIESLIRITEYPHKISTENLRLSARILRDADMSQAFSTAWIQQVVFGLASEWGKPPIEILKLQKSFLGNLKFHTEWAQKLFPQSVIDAKIQEAEELLALLQVTANEGMITTN